MKKMINLFILLVLFIIPLNLNAQSSYETTSDSKLRSGPGAKYKSVGMIKAGEKVNVQKKVNTSWFKVEYKGKIGFLSSKFLVLEVATSKVEEIPKVEIKTAKSNFTLLYTILTVTLLSIGLFLIFRRKKVAEITTLSYSENKLKVEQIQKPKIATTVLQTGKKEVSRVNSNTFPKDESIIDVTGNTYNLKDTQHNLIKYQDGVPFWKHKYIYSHHEITNAASDQINFYAIFKTEFLKERYLDLEGNNNYAFILLFELLLEYDQHKDVNKLKNQLNSLGNHYPKTEFYCRSFSSKKLAINEYAESSAGSQTQDSYQYQTIYTDYDYWKLGSKYRTQLSLNDEEVNLLNKLWFSNNNFCSIEFCRLEILNLYLLTIDSLKSRYIQEQTTLTLEFTSVVDSILRKHFRYQLNSFNYKNSIASLTTEIYSNIFKHCENVVREHYGHKRKINTEIYFFATPEARNEFETKIINKVKDILPTLVTKLNPLNEESEMELYSQNTGRWKLKFEELTSNYQNKNNIEEFITNILSLGNLNKKNPSIENIFFEASKFISKYDKEAALSMYIHYLFYDLKSSAIDNKQLTKNIQKTLFKTNDQLHNFQILISELVSHKNLEQALEGVTKIYEVKRRKINLDTTAIKEVQQQDSGTVELLNEYLKDAYEDAATAIKAQEIDNNEIKIEITQKKESVHSSIYVTDIAFTQIHTATLDMFAKNNFMLLQNDLETFARSKGAFKNQLVESINEACFEFLDDVLIEEEEDDYTINPTYYQKLLLQ